MTITGNQMMQYANVLFGGGGQRQPRNPMQAAFSQMRMPMAGLSNMSPTPPAQGMNQPQSNVSASPMQGMNQPQTPWDLFKKSQPTKTGIYNNDWVSQTNADESQGYPNTQFKDYQGNVYFESGPNRAGGKYKPDLYANQLSNDMKALQEDISGYQDMSKKVNKLYETNQDSFVSPYIESLDSSMKFMNEQFSNMKKDYDLALTGATEGYMGFSPYQRATFNLPKYNVSYYGGRNM